MSDNTTQSIFTQSYILMVFGFLAVFSILGVVSGNSAIFDIIVISSFALYISYIVFYNKNAKTDAVDELRKQMSDFNTVYYVGTGLILLHLAMFIASKIGDGSPFSIGLLISVAWIYMVVLLLVNFTSSVFNIPVLDMIFNDNLKKTKAIIEVDSDEKGVDAKAVDAKPVVPVSEDEVFNISNNLYTYEDARNICSAYGAKLATYDDMEKAYNGGAEWCNYGWSEDQMAFFPTQKATWTELQKSEKKKNNCGRPGINGGYMANPNIKFGVNCFGKKPKASDADLARLSAATQASPLTPEDEATNAKIKYWKDNAEKMLVLNSYNRKKWSEY
jgi:hypothetical protein